MNPLALFFTSFYRQEYLRAHWKKERQYVWSTPAAEDRRALQRTLERMYGGKNITLTQSGRSALRLALRATGVSGKRIGVPSFICAAVIRAILAEGSTPVFIDIDEQFRIRRDSLLDAIERHRIAAVIAPHYGGIATNIRDVMSICRTKKVKVIEDAAQSFGLEISGKPAGMFGDVGILSFGIGKMTTGFNGGALISAHVPAGLLPAEEPRRIQRIGFLLRYVHRRTFLPFFLVKDRLLDADGRIEKTGNDPLLRIQEMSVTDAAILREQTRRLPQMLRQMAVNARIYAAKLPKSIINPPMKGNIFLKYMVAFPDEKERDRAAERLRRHRVETEGTYQPQHLRGAWGKFPRTDLRSTMNLYPRLLSLPTHAGLDAQDIERICRILREDTA